MDGNGTKSYAYYTQEFGSASTMKVNLNNNEPEYPLVYPLLATFYDEAGSEENYEISDVDKYLLLGLENGTLKQPGANQLTHEKFSVYGQTAARIGGAPYTATAFNGLVGVGPTGVALLFNMNLTATTANSETNIVIRSEAFATQSNGAKVVQDALGAYTAYFKAETPEVGDMYAHIKLGSGVMLGADTSSGTGTDASWKIIQEENGSIQSGTAGNYVQMTPTDMRIKYDGSGSNSSTKPIHIFAKKAAAPGGAGTTGSSATSYAASSRLNNGVVGDKYLVLTGTFASNIGDSIIGSTPPNFMVVHKENANTTVGTAIKMKTTNAYLALDGTSTFTNANPVYVFAKRAAISSGDISGIKSYVAGAAVANTIIDDKFIYVQANGLGLKVNNLTPSSWHIYQENGGNGGDGQINAVSKLTQDSGQSTASKKAVLTIASAPSNTSQLYLFAKSLEVLDNTISAESFFHYQSFTSPGTATADKKLRIKSSTGYYIGALNATSPNVASFVLADGITAAAWAAGEFSSVGSISENWVTGATNWNGTSWPTNTHYYLFLRKRAFSALPPVISAQPTLVLENNI
jgi:hypothetical protein